MRAFTHDQGIDFLLTCFLESLGRSTSASKNSPSLCCAPASDESGPHFASVVLREFSSLRSKRRGFDVALPAHANGNSLESCKCGGGPEAGLQRKSVG